MRDEGVREGGVGEGDEQELDPGPGPGDSEAALGPASGREGRDGLDQAHAEREREREVAQLRAHGPESAADGGDLPAFARNLERLRDLRRHVVLVVLREHLLGCELTAGEGGVRGRRCPGPPGTGRAGCLRSERAPIPRRRSMRNAPRGRNPGPRCRGPPARPTRTLWPAGTSPAATWLGLKKKSMFSPEPAHRERRRRRHPGEDDAGEEHALSAALHVS